MTLIHTAERNKVELLHYLVSLLHHSAKIALDPAAWMPWNYSEVLAQAEAENTGPPPDQLGRMTTSTVPNGGHPANGRDPGPPLRLAVGPRAPHPWPRISRCAAETRAIEVLQCCRKDTRKEVYNAAANFIGDDQRLHERRRLV